MNVGVDYGVRPGHLPAGGREVVDDPVRRENRIDAVVSAHDRLELGPELGVEGELVERQPRRAPAPEYRARALAGSSPTASRAAAIISSVGASGTRSGSGK